MKLGITTALALLMGRFSMPSIPDAAPMHRLTTTLYNRRNGKGGQRSKAGKNHFAKGRTYFKQRHGKRECERRMRQIERGILTASNGLAA